MLYSDSVSKEVVAARAARVYVYLAISLLMSLAVAYFVGTNASAMQYISQHLSLQIAMLVSPMVIIVAMCTFLRTLITSRLAAAAVVTLFSCSMGLSISGVFAAVALPTIITALISTVILFTVAAAYGYATKRIVDNFYDFLIVGLIVLIAVSVLNIVVGSSWLTFAISCAAVIIYLGLTVYDASVMRTLIEQPKVAVYDEMMLVIDFYLDFIGLFVNLVTILNDD